MAKGPLFVVKDGKNRLQGSLRFIEGQTDAFINLENGWELRIPGVPEKIMLLIRKMGSGALKNVTLDLNTGMLVHGDEHEKDIFE